MTEEEQQEDERQIAYVINLVDSFLNVNAIAGEQLAGENIVVGLLYVATGIISKHPDKEYQLKLLKQIPNCVQLAYDTLAEIRRRASH